MVIAGISTYFLWYDFSINKDTVFFYHVNNGFFIGCDDVRFFFNNSYRYYHTNNTYLDIFSKFYDNYYYLL